MYVRSFLNLELNQVIQTRFFIGEEPIEYSFNEENLYAAINDLSMLYYEKMGILPIAVFLSPDLYKFATNQNRRITGVNFNTPGIQTMQFMTGLGVVLVQPVPEPKERFIYAGNQQGYQNALIDKRFEEIILEFEE